MKKIIVITFIVAITGLAGCSKMKNKASGGKLETETQKYSYALGQQFGSNIAQLGVELDKASLMSAIEDALDKKESKLSERDVQEAMVNLRNKRIAAQKERAEKNKTEGEAFLAQNKTKEGVVTTESGLQYKILQEGTGKTPTDKNKVKVHYKGTLIDGTEFDSSYKREAPAVFGVGGVIKGWTEALQLMKEGAKWQLFIPAELAYGTMDRPTIPGNSVLIFEVELLEVLKD
ncbi:MAG: FKBP-type peptidyl-prolyl cis-trans isomerase [Bdellovibrionales bacterium]|nr:FKBP-type peptidyl-prolyl cis-trans isomerase [Bdellovibrionales bacterium]